MGSNPTRRLDVFVLSFCVCVILYVVSLALRRTDPLSNESYGLYIGLGSCKKAKALAAPIIIINIL
jgi:hypothetical protein